MMLAAPTLIFAAPLYVTNWRRLIQTTRFLTSAERPTGLAQFILDIPLWDIAITATN
jgi:hypothetical protein